MTGFEGLTVRVSVDLRERFQRETESIVGAGEAHVVQDG